MAAMLRWPRLGTFADSAVNLGVFRVVVGVVMLRLPDLHDASRWAALPVDVRTAPVGLEGIAAVVPIAPGVVHGAYLVLVAALITATLGVATRLSWLLVTALGLYVLGVPQLAGSVFHYHHLIWFAALLAASPSGDALSVDAWLARRRGRPPPARDAAYGLPLRLAWVLIGLIFLFPGLWKLITSGGDWIFSDNLRNQMWAKWAQMPGFTPLLRVDRYPWLMHLGALSVVLLEILFLPLVLYRRTRLFAVAAALVFHQLTAQLMGLRFPALWWCYVAFVDWDRLVAWWRRDDADAREAVPRPVPASARRTVPTTAAVGAILVAGVATFGTLGISDGWPFACYPKFDRVAAARLPAMEVELVYPDGSTFDVPVEWMSADGRSQRWWALSWSLLGAHDRAEASPERFRAFWDDVATRPRLRSRARAASAVRLYRVWLGTDPDRAADPPLARRLLYELPLES